MLELINAERAAVGAQPLAFNGDLNESADAHTAWMIDNDQFQHSGENGSEPKDRMEDAGYQFTGSAGWAENIAYHTTSAPDGFQDDVDGLHEQLVNSPGHYANMTNPNHEEVGVGFKNGEFNGADAGVVTENFAYSEGNPFITGVAFRDANGDGGYDIDEGLGGLTVMGKGDYGGFTTTTTDSGGYKLQVPDGEYELTFSGQGFEPTTQHVTVAGGNVKADLIDPGLAVATPYEPGLDTGLVRSGSVYDPGYATTVDDSLFMP